MDGIAAPPVIQGRVLRYYSNFYYVQTDDGCLYECFVRGLLKKAGTVIIAGDRVELAPTEDVAGTNKLPTAWITHLEARHNQLTRPKVANLTQVLLVHPVGPDGKIADWLSLDRTLLAIRLADVPVCLCLNKVDLFPSIDPENNDCLALWRHYGDTLRLTTCMTSICQPESLTGLTDLLAGQVSVLAGLSGAGKSSLLNRIWPAWQRKVAERTTVHGTHITRHVELLALPGQNGWVADSPGFRLLSFDQTAPAALARALPEAEGVICQFDDCLHLEESGCSVRPRMHPQRYANYQQFQKEASNYRQTVLSQSQKQEDRTKSLDRGKNRGVIAVTRLNNRDRAGSRRSDRQRLQPPDDDDA